MLSQKKKESKSEKKGKIARRRPTVQNKGNYDHASDTSHRATCKTMHNRPGRAGMLLFTN